MICLHLGQWYDYLSLNRLAVPENLVSDNQSFLRDSDVFFRDECLEEVFLILIDEDDVLGKRASFELTGIEGATLLFKCPNDDLLRGKADRKPVSLDISVD